MIYYQGITLLCIKDICMKYDNRLVFRNGKEYDIIDVIDDEYHLLNDDKGVHVMSEEYIDTHFNIVEKSFNIRDKIRLKKSSCFYDSKYQLPVDYIGTIHNFNEKYDGKFKYYVTWKMIENNRYTGNHYRYFDLELAEPVIYDEYEDWED